LKCILYFRNCNEIDKFVECFNKLNKYYAYEFIVNKITYKDSHKERNKKLDEFNESKITSFICSVDILNECIDIPTCNSIYMTYNCKSKINCIQRMCRSNRIDKDNIKKVSNILLYCEEIDECLTFISAIKELDLDFSEKISYLECSNKLKKQNKINEMNKLMNIKYIKKIIGIQEYRGFNWTIILDKVKKYIEENHKRPSIHDEDKEIKKMGQWITHQITNYNKKQQIMKNEEIRIKWEEFTTKYKEYFISDEEKWYIILDKVKKYIEENKKRPSASEKDKEIKKMGKWTSHQTTNYNKKQQIMKNEKVRFKWKEFIGKYFKKNLNK